MFTEYLLYAGHSCRSWGCREEYVAYNKAEEDFRKEEVETARFQGIKL